MVRAAGQVISKASRSPINGHVRGVPRPGLRASLDPPPSRRVLALFTITACAESLARLMSRRVSSRVSRAIPNSLHRLSLTLAFIVACAVVATPTPASAATIRVLKGYFGAADSSPANPYPLTSPTDVAVDNSAGSSSGDIYVTDPSNHRIEKFNPAGRINPYVRQGC